MTNVALIGLGMVSGTYADALAELDGVSLRGVYARTPDSRAAWLAAHPGPKSYASVAEIAADDAVDFVILTTPPNARRAIVGELAAAGKHILMEKPVERSVAAATELVEICEAAGVTLGIMLQHRARPSAIALQERLADGAFGPLLTVECIVPWWRTQAYYDEPGRGTYERDGGGVLISQAIHTLDLMLSLTGPVKAVTAMTGTTGFHKMEAEDFVTAGLAFENGALGTMFATTASYPGGTEHITLNFARATVRMEGAQLTVSWQDGRREEIGAVVQTGGGADPMAFTSDWHRDMIADFADAIATGRAPVVTGREALGVHRLIAALETSGKTGQRQELEQV